MKKQVHSFFVICMFWVWFQVFSSSHLTCKWTKYVQTAMLTLKKLLMAMSDTVWIGKFQGVKFQLGKHLKCCPNLPSLLSKGGKMLNFCAQFVGQTCGSHTSTGLCMTVSPKELEKVAILARKNILAVKHPLLPKRFKCKKQAMLKPCQVWVLPGHHLSSLAHP